jgi:hypothetical protein
MMKTVPRVVLVFRSVTDSPPFEAAGTQSKLRRTNLFSPAADALAAFVVWLGPAEPRGGTRNLAGL